MTQHEELEPTQMKDEYNNIPVISLAYFLNSESDQCQNSPAASQEMWHHTVWRTWLFIAYSDEKWLFYKFSLHHSYNRFLKGWENTLFELRNERVKTEAPEYDTMLGRTSLFRKYIEVPLSPPPPLPQGVCVTQELWGSAWRTFVTGAQLDSNLW